MASDTEGEWVPGWLRALLARKARRVEVAPEEPVRILAEWQPVSRFHLSALEIPSPYVLAFGAIVSGASLIWLLSSAGKGDMVATALFFGIWPLLVFASAVRRLPANMVFRLTEHSIRNCADPEGGIVREVLFGWVRDIQVVPSDRRGRDGHVILWPHDRAPDVGAALRHFEDRLWMWPGLVRGDDEPFVLWSVKEPHAVAETIRRAVKSLPLNPTGAYR